MPAKFYDQRGLSMLGYTYSNAARIKELQYFKLYRSTVTSFLDVWYRNNTTMHPHYVFACTTLTGVMYSIHLKEVRTCVEVHTWKVHMLNKTCMYSHVYTNNYLLTQSIALHFTNILLVDQHNVMHHLFSNEQIKS